MTSRTIAQTATTITAEPFPDYPPRDDMQNYLHLSRQSHMSALERFYASTPGVLVGSEFPISQFYGDYTRVRIPDLLVSFDSDMDLMIEHNGYAIDRQGSPPNFALEVASVSTAARDETQKRADYALFGISEYWRFDPTGGERYESALAGDRLADDGSYRPVPVEWLDDERCRGWSEALGLYVCWERGQLRFYDPETRQYLRTYEEEADRADRAEAELVRLRARLQELGEDDI